MEAVISISGEYIADVEESKSGGAFFGGATIPSAPRPLSIGCCGINGGCPFRPPGSEITPAFEESG
jgi:hypothetical protein